MTVTRRSRTAAAVAAALTLTTLSACATGETTAAAAPDCFTGTGLVLVVPVHQNAQAPGIPSEWDCALDAALRAEAPIGMVTAEGHPQVVLEGYVASLTAANPHALNDQVAAAKNAIIVAAARASATSDGNDLLAALALGADLVPGAQVLSLDNGATDTGVLRTADEGMTTLVAAADVAQFVVDAGACPAVDGARVDLYGLGYQVAPAEPISQRQRDLVAATWVAVLTECGAQATAIPLPRTGTGPEHVHTARPIQPEADPGFVVLAQDVQDDCEAVLPDSVIGFVADEARFLAPGTTHEVVAEAARHLADCVGTVEVIGTTSSAGTAAGREALSARRAEAVRDLLAGELGIPVGDISAHGLGYDTEAGGCVVDRVDGVLDPVLAAQNRKVVIRIVP